jgi:protease-4
VEAIDQVARGRVWSGRDALEHDLVDELGGLGDAIEAAAELAKLGENYQLRYVEKEVTGFQRFLLDSVSSRSGSALVSALGIDLAIHPVLAPELAQARSLLRLFGDAREHPLRSYAYCFCEVRD